MPGLEPETSRLSMLSDYAYHLRYIPVDPSALTHSLSGPDLAGLSGLQRLRFWLFTLNAGDQISIQTFAGITATHIVIPIVTRVSTNVTARIGITRDRLKILYLQSVCFQGFQLSQSGIKEIKNSNLLSW